MIKKLNQLSRWHNVLFWFAIAICTAIIFFGGGKLLVYIGILLTGLIFGWHAQKIVQLVRDYRLGLKMNSLQYSAKQSAELMQKNEQMEKEIGMLNERLKVYQAQRSVANGNQYSDRVTRIRKDFSPCDDGDQCYE